MEEVRKLVNEAIKQATGEAVDAELTRPDEQFGDYATSIAMQLRKDLNQNPLEIAQKIVEALPKGDIIAKAEIAGPGFINLTLTDEALLAAAQKKPAQSLEGKTIVAEYSDPNPFKVLHAGHLYTSVVGDAIASLLANAGAKVHKVNFGGDVGLHVGKTMWAIVKELDGEKPQKLANVPKDQRSEWMAARYVEGNNAFDDDEVAKAEIIKLNKQVYKLHEDNDHQSAFSKIYWTCRKWSYDYFNDFYASIGTGFEKYYPESVVAELGVKTVEEHIEKGVFEKSDGAIVFRGEPYGLHTRVFINSEGIPTYEAKDVGLIFTKKQDYDFDLSVVITGNEQEQYMQVVLKAIEQFAPELVRATKHLTHGIVKLKGGVKMSSRKGNILKAVDILNIAKQATEKARGKTDDGSSLAAVKYAFLKQRTGGDIIYDPEESVSIEGNSGPYLQYAHARARSIMAKSSKDTDVMIDALTPDERSLVRKLGEYSEVVNKAVNELMPHHICTYLYELSQDFNRFYEKNRVVGHEREAVRLHLVAAYADTLKAGLGLLNIPAPDRM